MNVIEKGKVKAKRKIKALDFTGESAAIALVSKDQGGPANSVETLVVKSQNISLEYLEKMQAVKVTMSTPEFLERFFGLWSDQAEVLAAMMGYEEVETSEMEIKDWVQERLQAFEVIKSLHESSDLEQALAGLDEKQYLALLKDQEMIEKALAKKESEEVAKAAESDTSHIVHEVSEGKTSVITKKSKEKHMTKPVTEATVEMVEKSVLVDLQKSLEDKSVELQKALDSIAVFKQEKQEQITKSKTAQLTAVVKDEKLAAPIVKAALALESDEDFTAFLGAITSMQVAVEKSKETLEKSALFQEQGASVSEDEKPQESAVARVLKANLAKQAKQ